MKERKAVYAGSFDPPHNGHEWLIRQASSLFDKLVVTIGVNPDKKPAFSLEERLDMLKEITKDLKNVEIDFSTSQYTVNYAQSKNAKYIIKGLRSSGDYEFESSMNQFNQEINPNLTTVFLMTPVELAKISSSAVKGLVGFEGWQNVVKNYLPDCVYGRILKKYENKK